MSRALYSEQTQTSRWLTGTSPLLCCSASSLFRHKALCPCRLSGQQSFSKDFKGTHLIGSTTWSLRLKFKNKMLLLVTIFLHSRISFYEKLTRNRHCLLEFFPIILIRLHFRCFLVRVSTHFFYVRKHLKITYLWTIYSNIHSPVLENVSERNF